MKFIEYKKLEKGDKVKFLGAVYFVRYIDRHKKNFILIHIRTKLECTYKENFYPLIELLPKTKKPEYFNLC